MIQRHLVWPLSIEFGLSCASRDDGPTVAEQAVPRSSFTNSPLASRFSIGDNFRESILPAVCVTLRFRLLEVRLVELLQVFVFGRGQEYLLFRGKGGREAD